MYQAVVTNRRHADVSFLELAGVGLALVAEIF